MNKSTLRTKYETEIKKSLGEKLGIKNPHAVPHLVKIVVNMGTGESLKDKGVAEKVLGDMAAITGQKPSIRKAKVSVAGFNLRAGMPVGVSVTLRGEKMYNFLHRLISIVLPRLRDFRGVPTKSFDNSGNYTLGFAEHTVFPEIDLAKVDKARGLEVTIVTNTSDRQEAKLLLKSLGMPFEKP